MLTYHLFRLFSTFENSSRTLPNNGCCSNAYSISTFENSSRILQTRMSNYCLFGPPIQRCSKTWMPFWYSSSHHWHTVQHFQMASLSPFPDGIYKPISDDLPSPSPNGIYNPIPDITYTVKYRFRRVQIYGHSSVQSSSTFRWRKPDQPIYILRFKKTEQGKLLYHKIFPPIFTQDMPLQVLNCSRMTKDWLEKFSS